jgi:hypothetical protein
MHGCADGDNDLANIPGNAIFIGGFQMAGMAAMELPVARAIRDGGMMFFQKRRMPSIPAAIKAYRLKAMKKYKKAVG